ncbi:MAG: hypothetical protein A2787_09765 [Omnitrophica WOR_2 bacterium RIFCSPHIGHO2_01_FULL_48_9]|nr:MAG: hypothetical protein A3D10_08835 [Omnitrophica WOR_2 bacterium RIFCSPHIGHO2_02_FULL_48_11]OGX32439.1 MAG: hypothetical protein A2787_09765 [Omnitrophica WOR_2 bacterium RIFCSPHIGHO2_01_FULL_48_9]
MDITKCKVNTALQLKQDHRFEVLDLWKKAIAYFNVISNVTQYFPEKNDSPLDQQVKESALSIPNNIARGTKSYSKEELNDSLDHAVESVASTISTLNIAREYNYLRGDLFDEVYREGKLLAKRIEIFKEQSNLNLN